VTHVTPSERCPVSEGTPFYEKLADERAAAFLKALWAEGLPILAKAANPAERWTTRKMRDHSPARRIVIAPLARKARSRAAAY
jgi:hypothetical protein